MGGLRVAAADAPPVGFTVGVGVGVGVAAWAGRLGCSEICTPEESGDVTGRQAVHRNRDSNDNIDNKITCFMFTATPSAP